MIRQPINSITLTSIALFQSVYLLANHLSRTHEKAHSRVKIFPYLIWMSRYALDTTKQSVAPLLSSTGERHLLRDL